MRKEPLAVILTSDIAAQCRGRAVSQREFQAYLTKGSGWVPGNAALNPFGQIIEPNVYGSTGDVRIQPDARSVSRLTTAEGDEVKVVLGDLKNVDGSPWDSCPRTFLRDAIKDLEKETGLRVVASFEHEFSLLGSEGDAGRPFALRRLMEREPLGSAVMAALDDAGLEPEMWLPEYADGQWEVTIAPTDALQAADRAIYLREIVRNIAHQLGHEATFTPVVEEGGGGSGVHVHLSLIDEHERPVLWDDSREGSISEVGGSFAAGILQHAPALVALAASGVVSYDRLAPGNWSVGGAFLGQNNREALLRICPLFVRPNANSARQYNLEFRAADATSNPWLLLGALIRAGLEGIRAGLETPKVVGGNLADLTEEELAEAQSEPLPTSLEEALEKLDADAVAKGWFSPRLFSTFMTVKRSEIEYVAQLPEGGMYEAYARAY